MKPYRTWLRWGMKKGRSSKFVLTGASNQVLTIVNAVIPAMLCFCIAIVVYEFGFKSFWQDNPGINFWLRVFLMITALMLLIRLTLEAFIKKKRWVRILNIAALLFVLFLVFVVIPAKSTLVEGGQTRFVLLKLLLYGGILIGFITETSHYLQSVYRKNLNPGVLFVSSFGLLIFLGAFLLKLPNATYNGISGLDALFTSTSAVCVTGLIVVDTATYFTPFGHLIIMLLIQVGGLGFMTVAGLLAYAVAGQTSFNTQVAYKDLWSSKQVGNIMHLIYNVTMITLLFESIGAATIYFSLDGDQFNRTIDRIFFSVFHSVSAFCNAGFSTATNGLHHEQFRFNYPMQLFIALLIILGGMGFPVVFSLYKYLKVKLINSLRKFRKDSKRAHFPGLTFINARLALAVSLFLLVTGFIAYLVFEQSATLMEHPTLTGKMVTAFFGSVTPRTAGFNTVDISALAMPTIMIYLLLMWIGASPGSTGGGIKTTTFGVALLNMASVVRGKDRTEFFRSEISHLSVRRAFAIIVLSLLFIGVAVFLVSLNDGEKGLISITFEIFSAFSTVGLSLGVTADFSWFSKIILMITMFTGRIGMVTLLIIFIKQSKPLHYRFPKEDIAF